MKQMIILLTTLILGIAISAMVLTFRETTQTITDDTRERLVTHFSAQ
jgi:hypothetical protein